MKTLNDFFKVINPSRCSDLHQLEIHHFTRSSLSTAVVQELTKQLSLTTGEKIQLARFGNGQVLIQHVCYPRNIAALLERIGSNAFVPKATNIDIASFRFDQLSSDEVCECANALAIVPFASKCLFLNGTKNTTASQFSDTDEESVAPNADHDKDDGVVFDVVLPPQRGVNDSIHCYSSTSKKRRERKKRTAQRLKQSHVLSSGKEIIKRSLPPPPPPPELPPPPPPPPPPPAKRFRNNEKWKGSSPTKLARSDKFISLGPTSVPGVEDFELDDFIEANEIVSTNDWAPLQNGRILRIQGLKNRWNSLSIAHYNTGRVVFQGNPVLARSACRLLSHSLGNSDSSSGDEDAIGLRPPAILKKESVGGFESVVIPPPQRFSPLLGVPPPPFPPQQQQQQLQQQQPPLPSLQLSPPPPPPLSRPALAPPPGIKRKPFSSSSSSLSRSSSSSSSGSSRVNNVSGSNSSGSSSNVRSSSSSSSSSSASSSSSSCKSYSSSSSFNSISGNSYPPPPPPPLGPPPLPPNFRPSHNRTWFSACLFFLYLLAVSATTLPTVPPNFGAPFPSDSEGDGPGADRPRRIAKPSPKKRVQLQLDDDPLSDAAPISPSNNNFEVEEIKDMAIHDGIFKFLIKWVDYEPERNTWEPAGPCFRTSPSAIADFLANYPCPAVPSISDRPITKLVLESEVAFFKQERSRKTFAASEMCFQQPQIVALFLRDTIEHPEHVIEDEDVDDNDLVDSIPDIPDDNDDLFPVPGKGFGGATLLSELPMTEDEIKQSMLPHLCTAHVQSRSLGRLKPTRYLHVNQKLAWKKDLVNLYEHLHNQLEEWERTKDPLLCANMTLEYAQFPTRVLLEHTTLSKVHHTTKVCVDGVTQEWDIPAAQESAPDYASDPSPSSQSQSNAIPHNCTTAKRAVQLYKNGRRKASNQTLHSFGVAPRNEITKDALHNLTVSQLAAQPDKAPITADAPFFDGQVSKNVSSKAMAIGAIDVFGFANDMLSLVVNVPATNTCPRPLDVHERFIKMLSCTSSVPDCVAYLLSGGSLTPLNKIPADQNSDLVAAGEQPQLRPINSGSMPMAHLGSNMLKSSHGKAATKKVKPIQKGFEANGCNKTIHAMRGAYNQGKAILSLDGINAFNAAKRQAVLDAAKILWPEATPFLEKFYNLPIPVLYLYYDKEGVFWIDVQHSWEGVKQGDTVSSLLYSLMAKHFIYDPLSRAFPTLHTLECEYEITPLAIIDDYSAILDCPDASDSIDVWSQWYIKLAYYITRFDAVANPVNIFRNASKDKLLLPNGAPRPPNPSHTYGIDLSKIITFDGIRVAGAPIGNDDFMASFADKKVDAATAKTQAIASLCPDEPQVALAMIVNGANKGLDYLIRNTPTVPILPALIRFDDHLMDTTLDIICPRDTLDKLPVSKVKRAKEILMLPIRNNGLDLLPSQCKAPCAYIACQVACATDKVVQKFSKSEATAQSVKDAYDLFVHFTSLDVNKRTPVSSIITADHTELLSSTHSRRLSHIYHSQYGIMRVLSTFLQQVMVNTLRQSAVPAAGSDYTSLPRLQKSEILHVLTTTSKGRIASVVTADLALPVNRIDADATRAIFCFNLSLPVHPFGQFVPEAGYVAQRCCKDNNEIFDTCGTHSNSCYYCHGQRNATHSMLRNAIVRNTEIAGYKATSEPSTYNLLQSLFFTPDQLKSLFPKYNDSGLANLRRKELDSRFKEIERASTLREQRALLLEITSNNHGRDPSKENAGVTRRADVSMIPLNGKGGAFLVDVTGIHDDTKASINKQLAYHLTLQKKTDTLFASNFHLAPNLTNSPAVKVAVSNKMKIYGLIEKLANIQARGFGPQQRLKFIPAAMTHRCEFASEFMSNIEYCVGHYKSLLRVTPHIDGLTPAKAAANFRRQFKTDLCVQMATGFGRQLLATVCMSLSASVS